MAHDADHGLGAFAQVLCKLLQPPIRLLRGAVPPDRVVSELLQPAEVKLRPLQPAAGPVFYDPAEFAQGMALGSAFPCVDLQEAGGRNGVSERLHHWTLVLEKRLVALSPRK